MVEPTPIEHACIDGRYIVEERVAEGGMGQVYRARHLSLGKVFALKVIAPTFADDDVLRARFNQEAKLACEISHPNIVSVVDFGEDPTVGAYMVMELVEGTPLIDDDAPPLAIRRALDLLAQIAEVLEHIHSRGIIHGDIKTDNILLVTENDGPRRRQVIRLLDFGLAQRMGTRSSQVDGTPQYVAPERISGAPASVSADIYALGILGFRLLTGRYPFHGTLMETLMAHVNDPVPTLTEARGEPVDEAIETLIQRALAKDPAERHTNTAAFRYELHAVMDMLALTRRRRTGALKADSRRDAMINVLFESSNLPQALLTIDGEIDVANSAFAQLLGAERERLEGSAVHDTPLVDAVPGLLDSLRAVYEAGRAAEQRARVDGAEGASLDLVIWLTPFNAETVHMLVRVDETYPAHASCES